MPNYICIFAAFLVPARAGAAQLHDVAIGLISFDSNHKLLAHARATWLQNQTFRLFSNASDRDLGTVALPDDAELADDPLHNNPGEARFMPALYYLRRVARARWYLLGDDDTYLFVSRLKRVLAQYDPRERLFFGVPSRMPFGNCDLDGRNCVIPLKDAEGRAFQWRVKDGRQDWCVARVGKRCPVAEVNLGEWCRVASDTTMPYKYRIAGGFLPEAREALVTRGVAPAAKHQDGTRAAFDLNKPVVAPATQGQPEFPLAVWPVGGFGMIISAGAAEALEAWQWRECIGKLRCGPGDMRLAACLARFAKTGLGHLRGLGGALSRHPVKTLADVMSLHREEVGDS